MLKFIAWSDMVEILQYSNNFLTLYSLYWKHNLEGILIMISATIPHMCSSVHSYCISIYPCCTSNTCCMKKGNKGTTSVRSRSWGSSNNKICFFFSNASLPALLRAHHTFYYYYYFLLKKMAKKVARVQFNHQTHSFK